MVSQMHPSLWVPQQTWLLEMKVGPVNFVELWLPRILPFKRRSPCNCSLSRSLTPSHQQNLQNRSEKKWSGRTPWIGMVPLRFLQLLMQTRLAFSFFSHSMWWSCSGLAVGMPGGQNQSQQLVINLRSWNWWFLRCHGYYVAEAKTFKAIGGVAIAIFVWRRIAISHTTLVRLCEVHRSKVDEAPEMVAGQHLVTNIPPLLSLFRMWHTTFVVILMKSRWHIPDLLEAMTSGPFSSVQLIGKHSFIESTHPKIPSIQSGFTYGKTDTIALLMWFLYAKLRTGPLHCCPLRIWMLIHCSCLCNFRLGGSSCVTGAAWKCYTKGCWRRLQHPWSWVQELLTFAPPKNGSPQCSKATLLEGGSLQLDTPAADAIGDLAAGVYCSQSMCEAFCGVHWWNTWTPGYRQVLDYLTRLVKSKMCTYIEFGSMYILLYMK